MRRRWARRLRRVGLSKLAAATEKGAPDEEAIRGPSICTGTLSNVSTPSDRTPGVTPSATPDPSVTSGNTYPSQVATTRIIAATVTSDESTATAAPAPAAADDAGARL